MLREVAEYPNSFGPLGLSDERIAGDRYTLCMGAGSTWNTVQRQRFRAEEVDAVLAEVRALLRARGRVKTQWEIGSTAQPRELVDLLLARGLALDREPYAAALVLRQPPPPARPGVVARRVETFDEFVAANEVQWQAFTMRVEEVREARALLAQRWRETQMIMHATWLKGEIVCAGTCAPTPYGLLLYGGATLASARGRGAYHALVCARWHEAATLGTPVLMTQAGAMSRAILERLGFEQVGHVDVLVDEFDARERESSANSWPWPG